MAGGLTSPIGIAAGTLATSSLLSTDPVGTLSTSVSGLTPNFAGLNVGTITSAFGADTKLNLFGADSSNTNSPGIGFFTATDPYPLLTVVPYTHGNTAINFEAYFNGGDWLSSYSVSNFQITNNSGNLTFNVASGVSPGGTITWTDAFYIDPSAHIVLATPGITASQAVVTDSLKRLTSLAYTSVNTASTIVSRDSSGNFAATGLNLSGLATAPGLVAIDSGKNFTSTTSSISPTFAGLTLGGASSTTTLVMGTTASALTTTTTALTFSSNYNAGNYISIGGGGRNLGVFNGGSFFLTWNLNYTAASSAYLYALTSTACALELTSSGGFNFRTAPSGTAGTTATMTNQMAVSNTGVVNIPNLTNTGIITADGSSNLASITAASTYTPTIGDGTNSFTTSTALGRYYKIGSLYFVSINLVWTSKGSASGASAIEVLLPATCAATDLVAATVGYAAGITYTSGTLMCANAGNSSNVSFYSISTGGAASPPLTVSQASTTGNIILNLTFWSV